MVSISVVVPIYNIQRDILTKCVKSLLNQTFYDIEIILINDGSTNDALGVCNQLKKADPRVLVIDQVNQGVSVARNAGIDAATGSWIAFVDPDDWLEKTYLEAMWNQVSCGADIIMCNCNVHTGDLIIGNDFLPYKDIEIIYDKNIILSQLISKVLGGYYPKVIAAGVPWAKLFKRSFILENDLRFVPKMVRMQDNIFCLYAINAASSICFIPERNYNYRKENEASVSFRYNENIFEYFEKYFFEVDQFIKKKLNNNVYFTNALHAKIITSINSFFLYYYFNKDNNKKWSENKKHLCDLLKREPYSTAMRKINNKYLSKEEKLFVAILKLRSINLMRLVYFAKKRSMK